MSKKSIQDSENHESSNNLLQGEESSKKSFLKDNFSFSPSQLEQDIEQEKREEKNDEINNNEFPNNFETSEYQTKTNCFNRTYTHFLTYSFPGKDFEDVKEILAKLEEPQELLEAFALYRPRNKNVDISTLKQSQYVKVKKYKGESVYFGEFINGSRHGKGIMIYGQRKLYEGDWENDMKHGKGYEILTNGSQFEGEYLNGKPESFGVFTWPNGEIYEGEWKNGLKHGSGMWKGIKGESYYGEWKNGKAEGYGIHIWRNGEKYEGEFKSFLKHGSGTEKFANGDFYTGEYANGKPNGLGEYQWANGSHYKGHFKNGLRHGSGVWKKSHNSDIFEGEWVNDKKCGFGLYRWESGNYYQGNYFDDLRHGYGEMHWIDDSAYYGNWERGIQNGEGQLFIPGEGIKKGIVRNNLLLEETNQTEEGKEVKIRKDSTIQTLNNSSEIFMQNIQRGNFRSSQKRGSYQNYLKSPNESKEKKSLVLPNIKAFKFNINDVQVKASAKNTQRSTSVTKGNQNANCYLTKKEMTRWVKYQGFIKQLPEKLKDVQDPDVCEQIRYLINATARKLEKKLQF